MTKIILNSDLKKVKDIMERIKENEGYCPCALKKTPETKCMCKNFRDMAEGECHCGLYKKIL